MGNKNFNENAKVFQNICLMFIALILISIGLAYTQIMQAF